MNYFFDTRFMFESIPKIIQYLPITLEIAVASMVIAIIIGIFTALIKIYKIPVLKQISWIYVSFIRGTPLLVQLYITYYGIPKVLNLFQSQYGLFINVDINTISTTYYALFAFSINLGAYLSETIRSAIESVDIGQFEAAESIGMNHIQLMLKIVLPQAALVALPNLGNTLISTVKDTSLIFMISIIDVMGEAQIIGARTLRFFEVYIAVSLIYWITCVLLERCFYLLEKRLRVYERSIV
ncbi:amino acid ABC transporter permease [Clostridium kluyveri]|uniref:amino acid ABC transporter permease n=1 Tax=Clostridium kluyveri TaxID=1534 RepID=UPI0022469C3C|nr:amino acid ABC transporter permease [Clostridium kluyveri]UZQ49493.1 amino acid ABC transporter permease [Clostridium kluyveri]